MDSKYASEPYRIKMIEPIQHTTRAMREEKLSAAGYNPFALRSEDVYIDLLTDSGTGAMSDAQWAAMMLGDEAYAGSRSFYQLEDTVQSITGYRYVLPVHQGRGAEHVLLPALVNEDKRWFISNHHFDTTRAHVELAGARALDCGIEEASQLSTYHPFKGNMDLHRLKDLIQQHGAHRIAGIIMTLTNNSVGGQPVSLANLQAVSELAQQHRIPLIIDGARYAENAFFIKQREDGYRHQSLHAIARACFDTADVFMMSAKKDGLVNIGGLLVVKDDETLFKTLQSRVVPYEGFPTYGGLAGRDMAALAVGLEEALEERYLTHRIDQVRYLADRLSEANIPLQTPPGGHAVFVDAKAFCEHLTADQFPAQSLVNELYLEAGIRAVEIGSFLLGKDPDTGLNLTAPNEFMRLTIPRRTYTYRHLDDVAEALKSIYRRRHTLRGLKIIEEPSVLRHFTAKLSYL